MSFRDDAAAKSARNRRRLAWAVPVVVAGVVAGGVAVSATAASGASPSLAERTPAQLIAAVESSRAVSLSGVFTETANLGIPTLPGGHSSASLSWQTFVSGSHTVKVWIDGADRQRVALTGQLSEADVVRNGDNLWTYTSDTNSVTHTILSKSSGGEAGSTDPWTLGPGDLTPAAAAAKLLAAVTPSTAVTVGSARTVAGRPAYVLTLRPKDAGSTVRKVTIAVDAKKFVPLRVQVFGSGSGPAFQTGFTHISFATPSGSTFDFTAPKGATASTNPFAPRDRHGEHGDHSVPAKRTIAAAGAPSAKGAAGKPAVLGHGWTSVLVLPTGAQSALSGGMLRDLTRAVGSSGQRLLHTALINALILPDGRTFVGAVSPSVLEHVAAATPR